MTWNNIATIHNTYGWEIGSHTVDHPLTAAADNPNLTNAQLDYEMSGSQAALAAQGYTATDFASPYGDYDNRSLSVIAKYYNSHRTFQDYTFPANVNEVTNTFPYYAPRSTYPYNNYLLTVLDVQGNVPVATVESYVDQAKANNQWLILVFHNILPSGASTKQADYQYNASDLGAIAAYVNNQNIPVVTVAQGLASGTNIMPNSGFNDGIADGWATNDSTAIKADQQATSLAGHGSYDGTTTGPLNSISISGSASGDTYLLSPKVGVEPGTTYTLTNFVNLTSTSGEIDFYVDEYNAAGAWIGGKYEQGITGSTNANNVQVGDVSFTYTPSTADVASADLQVIAHGSGTKAYVDNLQWLAPSGTVTPPPSKPGDVNGDGTVDALDLSTVLSNWGKSSASAAQGDLNSDGTVDALDLSTVLSNWSN
jgi:hypothetical protein